VVSRRQLIAAGFTRRAFERRIEAGWLSRLHDGVYALGHMALTRESHLLAAVYTCGPDALASHRAAGRLWGLLRGPRAGITVHRSRHIDPEDRAVIDGIPVTSLARTIVDLADVLTERELAEVVHESEVLRLFDLGAIERVLDRLPGRKGRHKLSLHPKPSGAPRAPPLRRARPPEDAADGAAELGRELLQILAVRLPR
jgi:hypothetical protein